MLSVVSFPVRDSKQAKKLENKAGAMVAYSRNYETVPTKRMREIITPTEIAIGGDGISRVKDIKPLKPKAIQPGSIRKTRIREDMVKKEAREVKMAMAIEAYPFLSQGFHAGLPEKSTGYHFTGNAYLTLSGINRRNYKTYTFEANSMGHKNLKYQIYGATSSNVSHTVNGVTLHLPRPMGGQFKFEDVCTLNTRTIENDKHIFEKNPDFPLDFRFRSLIFPNSDFKKPSDNVSSVSNKTLLRFFKAQFKSMNIDSEDKKAKIIMQHINNIGTSDDQMTYASPLNRSFYTSEYETFLSQLRCEQAIRFEDGIESKIEVHRKMVCSVMNVSNKNENAYVIPLCEEATVYIQIRSEGVYKTTPTCFIFSAIPKMTNQKTKQEAHLHVFGDMAYTMLLPGRKGLPQDRHEASMYSVGMAINEHDKIKKGIETRKFKHMITDPQEKNTGGSEFHDVDEVAKEFQDNLDQAVMKRAIWSKNNAGSEGEKVQKLIDSQANQYNKKLSASFLNNQAGKELITKTPGNIPVVHYWIASATFSFIAFETPVRNKSDATSKIYGFVQTFPFTVDDWDEPIDPKIMYKYTGTDSRSSATLFSTKSTPVSTHGSATPKSEMGDTRDDDDKVGTEEAVLSALAPSFASSMYKSSLPPDLELELELL